MVKLQLRHAKYEDAFEVETDRVPCVGEAVGAILRHKDGSVTSADFLVNGVFHWARNQDLRDLVAAQGNEPSKDPTMALILVSDLPPGWIAETLHPKGK